MVGGCLARPVYAASPVVAVSGIASARQGQPAVNEFCQNAPCGPRARAGGQVPGSIRWVGKRPAPLKCSGSGSPVARGAHIRPRWIDIAFIISASCPSSPCIPVRSDSGRLVPPAHRAPGRGPSRIHLRRQWIAAFISGACSPYPAVPADRAGIGPYPFAMPTQNVSNCGMVCRWRGRRASGWMSFSGWPARGGAGRSTAQLPASRPPRPAVRPSATGDAVSQQSGSASGRLPLISHGAALRALRIPGSFSALSNHQALPGSCGGCQTLASYPPAPVSFIITSCRHTAGRFARTA